MALKLALLLGSTVLTLVSAEIAYRCRLGFFGPKTDNDHWYYVCSDVTVEYSREFGYSYLANSRASHMLMARGYPTGCTEMAVNAMGNRGKIRGSSEGAALKILVFGDSFTAIAHGDLTWPDLLQDQLETRLSKKVSVVNFGRDGYGVLQMFDLAAAMVRAYKPDLAIVAFITDDLTRERFWLRTVTSPTGEKRIIRLPDPVAGTDSKVSVDEDMVNPQMTKAWCESMQGSRKLDDPLLRELHGQFRRLEKEYARPVDYFSLSTSFLFNRILHRDPYHAFIPLRLPPKQRIDIDDFAADARFNQDVMTLNQLGIPYYLVHLPVYQELKTKKYILNAQETALLESLCKTTRKQALSLTKDGSGDLEGLFMFPDDLHPSAQGTAFYADAVAEALIKHGVE